MTLNKIKLTVAAVLLIAAYGAANALAVAFQCAPCVQILSGFQSYLPKGELTPVSGTVVLSTGQEVPVSAIVVPEQAPAVEFVSDTTPVLDTPSKTEPVPQ